MLELLNRSALSKDGHPQTLGIDQPTQGRAIRQILFELRAKIQQAIARRSNLDDELWAKRQELISFVVRELGEADPGHPGNIGRSNRSVWQTKSGRRSESLSSAVLRCPRVKL